MRRRLSQIEQLEDVSARYNGFMSVMSQSLVAPNFTENGWGLTRAPTELVDLLKQNLHEGLDKATEEYAIEVIRGASEDWQRPLFIKQRTLNKVILEELQPMHEDWAGIPLEGFQAYGLRIYRNESILHMHGKFFLASISVVLRLYKSSSVLPLGAADRISTHIISCILHVDHDAESDPWPIFIEDFQGNTNEVVLESGDMLFYESSKVVHGRPRPFNGKWYSSIFVHYYPAEDWDPSEQEWEAHYAVPAHFQERKPVDPSLDRLVMKGTSFIEPDCPIEWCNSVNTIKWYGPAKEGVIMSTGYKEGKHDEL